MERKFSLEKRPEGTARSTGKSGLEPWYRQYTYQEEPINDQRPLHGDPRDEQDNDFSLMMIVTTDMATRASVSAPCPTSMLALHSQAIRERWQE